MCLEAEVDRNYIEIFISTKVERYDNILIMAPIWG